MLSGDNGILQKATEAKTQTGVEQEKEIIKLVYNSALARKLSNGDSTAVTAEDLNTELTNQGASADGSNPIMFTFANSKRQYTINSNGTIEYTGIQAENRSLSPEILNGELLGYEVDYSGYSNSYAGGWRIFYSTEQETFIITTTTSGTAHYIADTYSACGYEGYSDVTASEYGYTWNKMWIDVLEQSTGSSATSMKTRGVSKMTAYLCDSKNWESYVTGSANYASGGPTYELFIKAWNCVPSNTSVEISDVRYSGYNSVKSSGITTNILDLNGKGLFNCGYNYWISSPKSLDSVLYFYTRNPGIAGLRLQWYRWFKTSRFYSYK